MSLFYWLISLNINIILQLRILYSIINTIIISKTYSLIPVLQQPQGFWQLNGSFRDYLKAKKVVAKKNVAQIVVVKKVLKQA